LDLAHSGEEKETILSRLTIELTSYRLTRERKGG